jgi:hypothetical protein
MLPVRSAPSGEISLLQITKRVGVWLRGRASSQDGAGRISPGSSSSPGFLRRMSVFLFRTLDAFKPKSETFYANNAIVMDFVVVLVLLIEFISRARGCEFRDRRRN